MGSALAPDDIIQTHGDRAPGAREPLLVMAPLRAFLDENGLDAPSDLTVTPIGDGHSNVTVALSTGVVLRRPPRGPLPPSAHDVLREARILMALAPTIVRTPAVLAVCDDASVIGAPFYVMEMIDGDVVTTAMPPALDSDEQRSRVADELIDALVELHSINRQTLVPAGLGKPTGYLERQIRRFLALWEHNKTRELDEVEHVARWLQAHLPRSPPATVVHGDYRLGNTIISRTAPARLAAILDWEMATIGDPWADVGYLMIQWVQAGDPPSAFNLHDVTRQPGFPSRQAMVARYEQRSGRSVGDLDWYVVLALWKAVVFMEGNYKRAISGAHDDPFLRSFGDGVAELAQRAIDVCARGL